MSPWHPSDERAARVSQCCAAPVTGIEYHGMHPDHVDGVSEWKCSACGERRGCWTGRVLTGEQTESRYGCDGRSEREYAKAWAEWLEWQRGTEAGQ